MSDETDEIVKKLFESLLQRYQERLEESMKGREFILLYDKCHQVSLNRCGSYIDFPEWLKNKKATINLKNNDDKCFQYGLAVALHYQNIKNNQERISEIKPFIDQYNWKEINFPSPRRAWKRFESNNKSVALNILYVLYNAEEKRHAYK